jgi:hypothetical protein
VTFAFRRCTTGTGVDVIVSVGTGVDVNVRVRFGVRVRVGRGVNGSVEGRLVDVSAGTGEREAVGLPFVELQALNIRITKMNAYMFLTFIFLLY